MKFAVLAALLTSAVYAAGTKEDGVECKTVDDCKNKCSKVTNTEAKSDTKGKFTMICIPEAKCDVKDSTQVGSDTASYIVTIGTCLKAAATASKLAVSSKCVKSTDCAEKLKCGGTGEAATYLCLEEAKCGTEIDSKKVNCESALRNAISMAVAAVAVAYAL
jgi:hypothetical protein